MLNIPRFLLLLVGVTSDNVILQNINNNNHIMRGFCLYHYKEELNRQSKFQHILSLAQIMFRLYKSVFSPIQFISDADSFLSSFIFQTQNTFWLLTALHLNTSAQIIV